MQYSFLGMILTPQELIGLTESYLPAAFRESLILLSQDFLLEQIVTKSTREENVLDLRMFYITV